MEPVEPQGAAPAEALEEPREAPQEMEEAVEEPLEVQPEAPEAAPGAELVALLVAHLEALAAAHSAQVEVAPRVQGELLWPLEVVPAAQAVPGVAQEAVVVAGQGEEMVVVEVGWLVAVSPPVLVVLVAQTLRL